MTSTALICYTNLAESPLLTASTASSAATGYSAANAWDWLTTTYWSPTSNGVQTLTFQFSTAVSADYFGMYRHNLGTVGASVKLQHSPNGSTWTDAFTAVSPDDNEIVLQTFTSASKTWWRIRFDLGSSADSLFVGIVAFGPRLTTEYGMPAGFVVPRHSRSTQILNSKTEGGQFAGRSIIARGARSTITIRNATQAWARQQWEPFVRHAELKPFFFSRNHTDYPEDAVYCWADGEIPEYGINDDRRQTLSMPVQCLLSGE
jgi:hypothetical protein